MRGSPLLAPPPLRRQGLQPGPSHVGLWLPPAGVDETPGGPFCCSKGFGYKKGAVPACCPQERHKANGRPVPLTPRHPKLMTH